MDSNPIATSDYFTMLADEKPNLKAKKRFFVKKFLQ